MWLIFAGLSAIAVSVRNLLSKVGVDEANEYVVMWYTVSFALPVAAIALLLNNFEVNGAYFWYLLIARVLLDTLATFTFLKALKFKSASFVIPLLAFQPALTIVTSFFINNQVVGKVGLLGVLVISLSSFFLFLSEKKLTRLPDLPNLKKATFYIGITTIIYSVLDPLHAKAIALSNEYTYFFLSEILFVLIFSIIVLLKSKEELMASFKSKRLLTVNISIGILLGLEVLTLFLALGSSLFVAYVSAIRSSSLGITSVFAFLFLKEKLNPTKIISIFAILLGVLILTLN